MAATVVYLPESCVRVLTVPACLSCPVLRDACLLSAFYVRVLSVNQSLRPLPVPSLLSKKTKANGRVEPGRRRRRRRRRRVGSRSSESSKSRKGLSAITASSTERRKRRERERRRNKHIQIYTGHTHSYSHTHIHKYDIGIVPWVWISFYPPKTTLQTLVTSEPEVVTSKNTTSSPLAEPRTRRRRFSLERGGACGLLSRTLTRWRPYIDYYHRTRARRYQQFQVSSRLKLPSYANSEAGLSSASLGLSGLAGCLHFESRPGLSPPSIARSSHQQREQQVLFVARLQGKVAGYSPLFSPSIHPS